MLPKFDFSCVAKILQVTVHGLIIFCGLFYEVLGLRVVMGLGGRN